MDSKSIPSATFDSRPSPEVTSHDAHPIHGFLQSLQNRIRQQYPLDLKPQKRARKQDTLKVHPNDPRFRTALDGCHALALRYLEARETAGGIGSARSLMRLQNWNAESPVARLMEALVHAAPVAVRFEHGKRSAAAQFPEFRAWYALLQPLFGLQPPLWEPPAPPAQGALALAGLPADEDSGDMDLESEEIDEDSEQEDDAED